MAMDTMVFTAKPRKHIVTNKELIKIVSNDCGLSKEDVSSVIASLEKNILELLNSVSKEDTENKPMTIKLMEGMAIKAWYVPPTTKILSFNNDKTPTQISEKIRVRVNVADSYKDKVNMNWRINKN